MTETRIPEINVNKLMERIREEIGRRKARDCGSFHPVSECFQAGATTRSLQPNSFLIEPLPGPPPFIPKEDGYHIKDFLQYHDREFVRNAYRGIICREADPAGYEYYLDKLRLGERTKVEILGRLRYANEGRLKSVRVRGLLFAFVAHTSYRIPVLGYLSRLITGLIRLPTIIRNIQLLDVDTQYQVSKLTEYLNRASRSVHSKFDEVIAYQTSLKDQLGAKADHAEIQFSLEELRNTKADQTVLQSSLEELRDIRADSAELQSSLEELRNTKVDHVEFKSYLEELKDSRLDRSGLRSLIEDLNKSKAERVELEQVAAGKADQDAISIMHGILSDIRLQIKDHKFNILDQQRRIAILLEQARKHLLEPLSSEQIQTILAEEDHILDAMYVSFEDLFRGTREDIKKRQQIYLTYLEQAEAGSEKAPVLDVGCGRGEWLELLKENGHVSMGVDRNRIMVQQCQELGLDVVEADLIDFLHTQKPNTYGAITGFHIVEHLPLKSLIALLDESLRVLKPGGMVIFETPNPENLLVGASLFYADPTHRNPLFPDTLRFIVEYRGFIGVQTLKLHKRDEPVYTNQHFVDEIVWRANMEQDFSIIGVKP